MQMNSKDFSVFSPLDWAEHHFASLIHPEQLDDAYWAAEGLDGKEAWCAILKAMEKYPWPTTPAHITENNVNDQSLYEWVDHFWTSLLDSTLSDKVTVSTYSIIEKYGHTWECWLLVRKTAETLYKEWEIEVHKRKAV